MCTPKQIDLTSVFVAMQLPYPVSMLLLKSGCKSAPAQCRQVDISQHLHNTNVIIIWCLHKIFQENKLRLN